MNGENVPLQGRLISLTLSDKNGFQADELSLEISDHDGAVELPKKGVTLTAEFGFENGTQNKGEYIVEEVEHRGPPDVVCIRAQSADFSAKLLEQREESYDHTTLGEVLTKIAAHANLKPAIADKFKEIKIEHMDQHNESDANMLTRLAKDYGAVGTIKSGHLLFIERGSGKTASGEAIPNATINRRDGDQHSYRESARNEKVEGVRAYYHDLKTGKREKVEVKAPVDESEEQHSHTTSKDVRTKIKPKKKTKRKTKHKKHHNKTPQQPGHFKSIKRTYANKLEATKAAEAELKRLKQISKTLSLNLAIGRVDLFAEMPVQVIGFKPQIDGGKWFIKDVTHNLNDSGYTCSVNCEVMSD